MRKNKTDGRVTRAACEAVEARTMFASGLGYYAGDFGYPSAYEGGDYAANATWKIDGTPTAITSSAFNHLTGSQEVTVEITGFSTEDHDEVHAAVAVSLSRDVYQDVSPYDSPLPPNDYDDITFELEADGHGNDEVAVSMPGWNTDDVRGADLAIWSESDAVSFKFTSTLDDYAGTSPPLAETWSMGTLDVWYKQNTVSMTVLEEAGEEGVSDAVLRFERSGGDDLSDVGFTIANPANTISAGRSLSGYAGSKTIPAGQTRLDVPISIFNDGSPQLTESADFVFTNAGAKWGLDDPAPGTPTVSKPLRLYWKDNDAVSWTTTPATIPHNVNDSNGDTHSDTSPFNIAGGGVPYILPFTDADVKQVGWVTPGVVKAGATVTLSLNGAGATGATAWSTNHKDVEWVGAFAGGSKVWAVGSQPSSAWFEGFSATPVFQFVKYDITLTDVGPHASPARTAQWTFRVA